MGPPPRNEATVDEQHRARVFVSGRSSTNRDAWKTLEVPHAAIAEARVTGRSFAEALFPGPTST
jgi:hypothetical protein